MRVQKSNFLLMKNHSPFCFCQIIPDIVFENMKRDGIDVQSGKTNVIDDNFRERRATFMTAERSLIAAPVTPGTAARFVYDSQNTNKQRLKLARGEKDKATKDADVNAAHENAGIIRAYFKDQLGWDSIDGNAMDMLMNVHYLVRYNNAFWDGEEMTFGDGDGVNFSGFARALDVSGHEIAHGVIQFTSGLIYKGQSGALNEHFADVFGVAIHQFHNKQTAKTANWLVGESVLIGKHKGKAIRSMKTPSDPAVVLMPQPDHMDKIYKGKDDNGGVHINSGIPNKAFYLVSMEVGTQEATKLWFEALRTMKPTARFRDLHRALVEAAKVEDVAAQLPKDIKEILTTTFRAVGIVPPPAPPKPKPEPKPTPA